MRIKYNAPFTLTFSFAAVAVLLLDQYVMPGLTKNYFMVGGQGSFSWTDPLSYLRLVSHVLGHENWSHFLGNFSFLLLLGPVLEEKYQTPTVVLMALVTALVTGIINTLFFTTSLMGASGIVFMMILLVSFTNIRAGEIPLTLPLILVFFLGKEIVDIFKNDNISHFAHILGGIAGSLFGFLGTRVQDPPKISSGA